MILQIILIVLGLFLLIKGADFLVSGSESIAKRFHIPEMIIGLTIVSIGTSMPELFVSATSALEGHSDLAIGNVVGSNICNLLLILGISAIIREITFKRETRIFEIPITLLFTIVFLILANYYLDVSRIEGIILMILFLAFIVYTIVMSKKGEEFDTKKGEKIEYVETKHMNPIKAILAIIGGIVALKIGGDFVVDNSVLLATSLGISEKVISLTIVAIGTSLPELVTSVTAAIKGDTDIAIGNILGSNIFNIGLILGLSAVISPMTYSSTYNNQILVLIIGTILLSLFPFIGRKNTMTRKNGISYLILYAIYMAGLFII